MFLIVCNTYEMEFLCQTVHSKSLQGSSLTKLDSHEVYFHILIILFFSSWAGDERKGMGFVLLVVE